MYYDIVRIKADNNSYLIAGVTSLGIKSATDWFGATPNADNLSAKSKIIRTHIRTEITVLLCWYKYGFIRLR